MNRFFFGGSDSEESVQSSSSQNETTAVLLPSGGFDGDSVEGDYAPITISTGPPPPLDYNTKHHSSRLNGAVPPPGSASAGAPLPPSVGSPTESSLTAAPSPTVPVRVPRQQTQHQQQSGRSHSPTPTPLSPDDDSGSPQTNILYLTTTTSSSSSKQVNKFATTNHQPKSAKSTVAAVNVRKQLPSSKSNGTPSAAASSSSSSIIKGAGVDVAERAKSPLIPSMGDGARSSRKSNASSTGSPRGLVPNFVDDDELLISSAQSIGATLHRLQEQRAHLRSASPHQQFGSSTSSYVVSTADVAAGSGSNNNLLDVSVKTNPTLNNTTNSNHHHNQHGPSSMSSDTPVSFNTHVEDLSHALSALNECLLDLEEMEDVFMALGYDMLSKVQEGVKSQMAFEIANKKEREFLLQTCRMMGLDLVGSSSEDDEEKNDDNDHEEDGRRSGANSPNSARKKKKKKDGTRTKDPLYFFTDRVKDATAPYAHSMGHLLVSVQAQQEVYQTHVTDLHKLRSAITDVTRLAGNLGSRRPPSPSAGLSKRPSDRSNKSAVLPQYHLSPVGGGGGSSAGGGSGRSSPYPSELTMFNAKDGQSNALPNTSSAQRGPLGLNAMPSDTSLKRGSSESLKKTSTKVSPTGGPQPSPSSPRVMSAPSSAGSLLTHSRVPSANLTGTGGSSRSDNAAKFSSKSDSGKEFVLPPRRRSSSPPPSFKGSNSSPHLITIPNLDEASTTAAPNTSKTTAAMIHQQQEQHHLSGSARSITSSAARRASISPTLRRGSSPETPPFFAAGVTGNTINEQYSDIPCFLSVQNSYAAFSPVLTELRHRRLSLPRSEDFPLLDPHPKVSNEIEVAVAEARPHKGDMSSSTTVEDEVEEVKPHTGAVSIRRWSIHPDELKNGTAPSASPRQDENGRLSRSGHDGGIMGFEFPLDSDDEVESDGLGGLGETMVMGGRDDDDFVNDEAEINDEVEDPIDPLVAYLRAAGGHQDRTSSTDSDNLFEPVVESESRIRRAWPGKRISLDDLPSATTTSSFDATPGNSTTVGNGGGGEDSFVVAAAAKRQAWSLPKRRVWNTASISNMIAKHASSAFFGSSVAPAVHPTTHNPPLSSSVLSAQVSVTVSDVSVAHGHSPLGLNARQGSMYNLLASGSRGRISPPSSTSERTGSVSTHSPTLTTNGSLVAVTSSPTRRARLAVSANGGGTNDDFILSQENSMQYAVDGPINESISPNSLSKQPLRPQAVRMSASSTFSRGGGAVEIGSDVEVGGGDTVITSSSEEHQPPQHHHTDVVESVDLVSPPVVYEAPNIKTVSGISEATRRSVRDKILARCAAKRRGSPTSPLALLEMVDKQEDSETPMNPHLPPPPEAAHLVLEPTSTTAASVTVHEMSSSVTTPVDNNTTASPTQVVIPFATTTRPPVSPSSSPTPTFESVAASIEFLAHSTNMSPTERLLLQQMVTFAASRRQQFSNTGFVEDTTASALHPPPQRLDTQLPPEFESGAPPPPTTTSHSGNRSGKVGGVVVGSNGEDASSSGDSGLLLSTTALHQTHNNGSNEDTVPGLINHFGSTTAENSSGAGGAVVVAQSTPPPPSSVRRYGCYASGLKKRGAAHEDETSKKHSVDESNDVVLVENNEANGDAPSSYLSIRPERLDRLLKDSSETADLRIANSDLIKQLSEARSEIKTLETILETKNEIIYSQRLILGSEDDVVHRADESDDSRRQAVVEEEEEECDGDEHPADVETRHAQQSAQPSPPNYSKPWSAPFETPDRFAPTTTPHQGGVVDHAVRTQLLRHLATRHNTNAGGGSSSKGVAPAPYVSIIDRVGSSSPVRQPTATTNSTLPSNTVATTISSPSPIGANPTTYLSPQHKEYAAFSNNGPSPVRHMYSHHSAATPQELDNTHHYALHSSQPTHRHYRQEYPRELQHQQQQMGRHLTPTRSSPVYSDPRGSNLTPLSSRFGSRRHQL